MHNILLKIASGIEVLTTLLGLSGFLLFLLSKHIKPGLKRTVFFLLLFSVAWRTVISIFKEMSSRYASVLIIPFVLFAVYFLFLLQKTGKRKFKCLAIVLLIILFTQYIGNDLKHNKHDANYYAIAEIMRNSEKKREQKEFLIDDKDYERLLHLCKTDNLNDRNRVFLPYSNNFGHSYFPSVVDIDINNSIPIQDTQKLICSFSPRKNSKRRINLIVSPPKASLTATPALTTQKNKNNILTNGSIEEIDSPEESYKKLVAQISGYSSYYDDDGSVLTPKGVFFKVTSGIEKYPKLGIESETPIDGLHSASVKFNNGRAYLFFGQMFHNGQYQYSHLIRGKRGTQIQSIYRIRSKQKRATVPLCVFTIPDSRTYLISTKFEIEGLNETDSFIVGLRVQNGEALFDDFVLAKE